MAILTYWPEMGQAKPTNIDGNISYGGPSHYFIETPHTLRGRGVRFIETLRADRLTEQGQYKAGWNYYRVTENAALGLELRMNLARESLLD